MIRVFILMLMATVSFSTHSQTKVCLTVGHRTATATLVDNPATRELVALLQQGSIKVQMSDYGGFEKVGVLPRSFTTSNSQITTEPGDIMLYQGNNIVIFYGSNSWSYTILGRLDGAGADEVRAFLGTGQIELTLSLGSSSAIEEVEASVKTDETVYDLKGKRVNARPLPSGLYIINGKKTRVGHLKNC